jgi:two-component system chemotaxis response regulator CheY
MLIDASYEWATQFRAWLQKSDIELVEWSTSGTGWMTTWQKAKPEIVIIDLQLPNRDGLYCIEKLLSLEAQTPIVFTHSYNDLLANDVEMKALGFGAIAVLQKPMVEERFQLAIKKAGAAARRRFITRVMPG